LKVVFVNRFFYPDHSASSQMLSDLAFALAERGYGVEVITSRLCYDGPQSLPRRETVRGVSIVRLPTTGFGRANLPGRTLDYLSFYAALSLSLLWRVRRGDVVVAKTDPPMLSVIVAPIIGLKGARSVNWLQDIFPEVAVALGIGRGRTQKWVISILRGVRNLTLRMASANVVLGEAMARKLHQLGVPKERTRIIPNWADGRAIKPLDRRKSALHKDWGLTDVFVVGYSGNLGRAHESATFLAAITALEEQASAPAKVFASALADDALAGDDAAPNHAAAPKLHWLFIGGGARMEELKREVERRNLTSVSFQPYQPRERLAETLSLPDAHLISLRSELEGLIVPSKYYGIAAAGRPAIFVGHLDGEIAGIIRRSETGFAVREGDSAGLVHAILALANRPELAAGQGERARRLFEAEFDFPLAVEAWSRLIDAVAAS
jgi:colanic acid biosynthesis glycosyl transferase WcaI